MYDFCITPIYAFLLGCGGLAGYFVAGSTTSLLMGLGAALALGVLTYVSLQKFEQGSLCKPSTFAQLAITLGVTYAMYKRYSDTGKMFPAGATLGLSILMDAFLVWCLVAGPAPSKNKAAQAKAQ